MNLAQTAFILFALIMRVESIIMYAINLSIIAEETSKNGKWRDQLLEIVRNKKNIKQVNFTFST